MSQGALSHVYWSRHWADVVLNTPVLWAKITISQHHSLEKTRRKLERSKSLPLEVVINFRMDYTISITEQVILAMDLLRPSIWRIKSLHICVPNRQQVHAILHRCQEDAPRLETLTVQVQHSIQDERGLGALPLFKGHTPRLQSCSFTSFHFGWDISLLRRLHTLKLDGYFNALAPSPAVLVTALCNCPELEELSLRNILYGDAAHSLLTSDDTVISASSGKAAHLLRLTKASFCYVDISLVKHVMNHITFPNLSSLELGYLGNVTQVLSAVYNQALTRLPLRRLRIDSCLFSELMLLNVLRRVPSLTAFELIDVEDASSNLMKVSMYYVNPFFTNQHHSGHVHAPALDLSSFGDFDARRMYLVRLGFSSDGYRIAAPTQSKCICTISSVSIKHHVVRVRVSRSVCTL